MEAVTFMYDISQIINHVALKVALTSIYLALNVYIFFKKKLVLCLLLLVMNVFLPEYFDSNQ